MPADRIDAVVSLAKRRGFVFPSGEIYGGTRSAWDYGPLGVELKKNLKDRWWHAMVRARDDIRIPPRSRMLPSGQPNSCRSPFTVSFAATSSPATKTTTWRTPHGPRREAGGTPHDICAALGSRRGA